jgi:hypothetical protein
VMYFSSAHSGSFGNAFAMSGNYHSRFWHI